MIVPLSASGAEIKERLLWLVKLRWAACIGVLIATHVVREFAFLSFSLLPVYLILGLVVVYNIYFQRSLPTLTDNLQRHALQQIALDYAVLTMAIFFSGGSNSPFLYYYIFHVVISGIILPRRWTVRFAVAAVLLPASIEILDHLRLLPYVLIFRDEPHLPDISVAAAHLTAYASTLVFTAYFVTYLSEKLYRNREEVQRHYMLSERLRSSIILEDVVAELIEELSSLPGIKNLYYLSLNKTRKCLVYSEKKWQDADQGDRGEELSIPLADENVFSKTLLSCVACIVTPLTVKSEYEVLFLKRAAKEAGELVILPLWASFNARCYDYFRCPPDNNCPGRSLGERRCWFIPGTYCKGKLKRTVLEKLSECVECDMFMPVGILVLDITRASKNEPPCDLDLCMRLLDSASLALSNAKFYQKTLELSETDALTGIKNRRSFMKLLEAEIFRAHRYDKNFGLLMIDIDYFKCYNDTHGHPQGDILLKSVVEVMHGNLRETDAIGRYGGEEFIVILPETSPEKALDIAERIRDAVDKYRFPREDTQPGGKLTVSIGLASYPGDAATSTDIIQAADEVLYTAKHLGRNRVVAANKPLFL